MTTFLPLFIILRKFGQVSIFVDVVGKDDYTNLGCTLGIHRVARRDSKPSR
jgi:hypothetical protein